MSDATYTQSNANPVHRLRRALPDIVLGGSELFEDDRYWSWLDASLSMETLRIFMPADNTPGNTTATVEVQLDTDDDPHTLKLVLTPDVSGTETISLAPSYSPDRIYEVVKEILGYGYGWEVGLDAAGPVEWFDESNIQDGADWTRGVTEPANESLATLARASVFALTGMSGASAPLDAYGTYREDSQARLRFYRYGLALLWATEDLASRKTTRSVTLRKEGNVTRSWEDVAKSMRGRVMSGGIYAHVP